MALAFDPGLAAFSEYSSGISDVEAAAAVDPDGSTVLTAHLTPAPPEEQPSSSNLHLQGHSPATQPHALANVQDELIRPDHSSLHTRELPFMPTSPGASAEALDLLPPETFDFSTWLENPESLNAFLIQPYHGSSPPWPIDGMPLTLSGFSGENDSTLAARNTVSPGQVRLPQG